MIEMLTKEKMPAEEVPAAAEMPEKAENACGGNACRRQRCLQRQKPQRPVAGLRTRFRAAVREVRDIDEGNTLVSSGLAEGIFVVCGGM